MEAMEKTIVEIVIRVIDGQVSVNGQPAKEQERIPSLKSSTEFLDEVLKEEKRNGRARKLKRRSDFDKRFKEEKFVVNTFGRPRHKKRKTDK